jgi:hypothetical protein
LAVSLGASTQAGTSTGTFTEFSDISIQQVVNGQPVGGVGNGSNVPTTVSVSSTYDEGYAFAQVGVSTGLYSFTVYSSDSQISVIDGIPGESADIVTWPMDYSLYHAFNVSGEFYLVDPSGEFIGPNGDGSPDDVSVRFTYTYFQISNYQDSGFIATASVATIPEPSSIVMATSAALLILAWPILRARIGKAYTLTRGRARLNQS